MGSRVHKLARLWNGMWASRRPMDVLPTRRSGVPVTASDDDLSEVGGYAVERRLGAGGMGVVYLARSASGEQVAVKVIRTVGVDQVGEDAVPAPSGIRGRWPLTIGRLAGHACDRPPITTPVPRRRHTRHPRSGRNFGRSLPRPDVHSTHGSHMCSEGVPVPGHSCRVSVRRTCARKPGEHAGGLLPRAARPRLAIPGSSRP